MAQFPLENAHNKVKNLPTGGLFRIGFAFRRYQRSCAVKIFAVVTLSSIKDRQLLVIIMSYISYDLTEFESLMSLDNPINSSKTTRWERKANQQQQLDRYIPNRSAMEKNDENFERSENTETSEHAKLILANQMDSKNSRVLAFKNKAPAPSEGHSNSLKVLYSTQSAKRGEVVKSTRHIASAPVRVLDAPSLLDDYCKLALIALPSIHNILSRHSLYLQT